MVNLNTQHFSREIEFNLNIMQRTLDAGTAVDIGFVEIFENDLKHLASGPIDQKVVQQLQGKLKMLADRTAEIAKGSNQLQLKPAMNPVADVVVPLIRAPMTLADLANDYKDGATKAGLETLAPYYDVLPIKGDGHCLYRSILAGVLSGLAAIPEAQREEASKHLQNTIRALGNPPELVEGYKNYISAVGRLASHEQPGVLEQIVGDAKLSDGLVKFFRRLASKWNQTYGNDVFRSEAQAYSGGLAQYLQDQTDMDKAMMGGNPELVALSNALGVGIHVLHAHAIGKGEDPRAEQHLFKGPVNVCDLQILYRPGHYDLAIPKANVS